MRRRMIAGASLLIASVGIQIEAGASSVNGFAPSTSSWILEPSTNGWGIDRYAPRAFGVTNIQGRLALEIGIDPADSLANRPPGYQVLFYNTQGFQIPAGLGSNDWSVSASLLVTTDMTNGSVVPFRSDIWARTGPTNDESLAQYFIIGLFIGDTNNRANPSPSNVTAVWEIWDDVNGVWNYLPAAVTNGWNDVKIAVHNGAVEYHLGADLVYTETNIAFPDELRPLSTVLIEAYNFGNMSYAATWGDDWSIDRYAPHSVGEAEVQGRLALEIGVDPADSLANRPPAYQSLFYNTQGLQIQAGVGANNHWAAYGSLYVPPNIADGTAAPFRSDLWARTGPVTDENLADYFIVGLFAGNTNNRPDPNPSSVTVSWEVWDDVNGVWNYLPVPVVAGWNDLRISYDNGAVYYYLNSQLVLTDTNIGNPAYANFLSTVFLESYNFGSAAYTASWSGVGDTDASVPFLPATMTITTVTVTAQPGFGYDLQSVTNISPLEAWTPIAAATNTTGHLRYRLASPLAGPQQLFRSAMRP